MFSLKFQINIYYISYENIAGEREYFSDEKIIRILKIDHNIYREKMLECGAIEWNKILYFLKEEQGKIALEWIESVYILNILGSD